MPSIMKRPKPTASKAEIAEYKEMARITISALPLADQIRLDFLISDRDKRRVFTNCLRSQIDARQRIEYPELAPRPTTKQSDMDSGTLYQARKQIEQGQMLRAFYRLLWEAAHADPRPALPLEKCPLLPVEEIRHRLCDMLGIRRIAHKNADGGLRRVP